MVMRRVWDMETKTYQKKQTIFTIIFESLGIRQSHSVQRTMNN